MGNTNQPVGLVSKLTDKPATTPTSEAKPAAATPTAAPANPTSDASKATATVLPASAIPPAPPTKVMSQVMATAPAPQPATATHTGDRGAPPSTAPATVAVAAKPVTAEKPAPATVDPDKRQPGESKQAHKVRLAAAKPAAATVPQPGKPAPAAPAGESDLSNVLGFNFTKWPTTKTMAGAVPPLNVAVLSDGSFADADKPSEWAGRLHNGKPVTVTSTVTMLDALHAAGALGVTNRGVTNRMLALACILRPDSIQYSRKTWGVVCAFINGGTGETVDNFTIHSEAPAIRKRLYTAVAGTGQGGGKSYGVKLTPAGSKLISTAFAGLKRKLPAVWQVNG